jgi:hypothetical protein
MDAVLIKIIGKFTKNNGQKVFWLGLAYGLILVSLDLALIIGLMMAMR